MSSLSPSFPSHCSPPSPSRPPAGWAADMEGSVQSVDASERTVVLDNGTKVWLSDGVVVDDVKAGAEVKVSYEEKDGKPVAT